MTSSQRDELYRPKQRTWISPPSLSFTSALQPWRSQPGACCGLLSQLCLVSKQVCQHCIPKAHFMSCCNWRIDAVASQWRFTLHNASCPAPPVSDGREALGASCADSQRGSPVLLEDVAVLPPLAAFVIPCDCGVGVVPPCGIAVGGHGRQQARQRVVHLPRQRVPNHDDPPPLHAPAAHKAEPPCLRQYAQAKLQGQLLGC